jgi:type I restriction-modification system DNA methylase subunit
MSLETAVRNAHDLDSLVEMLTTELNWEIEPGPLEDITFEWSADELRVSESSAKRLNDGSVFQLRPSSSATNPPWGLFFVRFADKRIYRGALRQILRGLVPKQRRANDAPAWKHENLLFICATKDYERFTFAHFRGQKTESAVLSTFGWQLGDTHIRTLCEFNLPPLSWPKDESDSEAWLKKWSGAFDVERVTDEFFRRYNEVFKGVEKEVRGTIKDERQARLFTQKLFNRLMFIYFIQKKGWLTFKDDQNYLRALFDDTARNKQNFFKDRLYWLFFRGMGGADLDVGTQTKQELEARRGKVPPLNGGLFEIEDEFDVQGRVSLSNDAFARILALFERYNFTVEESTPLDVQVAVDPEMLGKVFEELVTGRHETGSYYTPRPIVSFMCREALKHYLSEVQPDNEVISNFVDEEDAGEVENPEAVLEALKRVRVCDPACGSGAYLLGMLHELTRLRAALFKSKKIDDATLYERKRWIIENNLYGVDNDKFAVQIACLRLWLSLAIESDEPHPLPNLDFKIECGDSLIAPAPSETEKQMTFARAALVSDFRQAKGEYMRETDPETKHHLRQRIENLRSEIALALKHDSLRLSKGQIEKKRAELKTIERSIESARNATIGSQLKRQAEKIRQTLAANETARESDTGFDWAVEFAEVFMPAAGERWRMDDPHPMLNDFKRQGTLVEEVQPVAETAGFDIVLANPPYGAELSEEHKTLLKQRYDHIAQRIRNSYLYFIGRAYEIARDKGVVCFIMPNEFLFQIYMTKARKFFLDNAKYIFAVNVGEDVFDAIVPVCVLGFQKQRCASYPIHVADLRTCDMSELQKRLNIGSFSVSSSDIILNSPNHVFTFDLNQAALVNKLASSFPRFEQFCDDVANGICTSCDEVYIVTESEIRSERFEKRYVKPTIRGGQFNRYYCPEETGEYVLYVTSDFDEEKGRHVLAYLKKHKTLLVKKSVEKKKGLRDWHVLFRGRYPELFRAPKIMFRQTADGLIAAIDAETGYFCINSVNVAQLKPEFLSKMHFLLGLLNSSLLNFFYRHISQEGGRVLAEVKPQRLRALPIAQPNRFQERKISDLVKRIFEAKSLNPRADTLKLEGDINTLVYELYNLNEGEITLVEQAGQPARRGAVSGLK